MSDTIEQAGAAFHFNAIKLTYSLFALLQGMEHVRELNHPDHDARQNLSEEKKKELAWKQTTVTPSYLDIHPVLLGVYDLDLITRGGEVEQLAYHGWVAKMFALWENPSRGNLKMAFETELELDKAHNPTMNFIQPEITPMGDLRHIRHDIVHKDAIASEDETGKCQVLKWFKPGERIILTTDHILDFLHHMGLLYQMRCHKDGETYLHCVGFQHVLKQHSTVRIVSIRTGVGIASDSTELLCLFSIVYSNGFYASHCYSSGLPDTDKNQAYLQNLLDRTYLTPSGNLEGPEPWLCVKASDAYYNSVTWEEKRQKNEAVQDFPVPDGGFPGPWMRFLK